MLAVGVVASELASRGGPPTLLPPNLRLRRLLHLFGMVLRALRARVYDGALVLRRSPLSYLRWSFHCLASTELSMVSGGRGRGARARAVPASHMGKFSGTHPRFTTMYIL